MYLKSQVFNLGETTNNRIESTFKGLFITCLCQCLFVFNDCTKYAGLTYFFLMRPFSTPRKGGTERVHWEQMG